ncbi:glycerate kinase [Leifsonia shinshuensis]
MRTVVFAPDSFKGSATATEVAAALAAGWSSVRPDDRVVLAPMADGGEGTLDAFEVAVPGALRRPVRVTGPDGAPRDTSWLLLPDGRAVVELAETSGIGLMPVLEAFDAQTTGFGQAIAAALDAGATALLLAIGGSASTDGGAGMLTALGARLLDADGDDIVPGNRGLAGLSRAELTLRALPPGGARVLSDVTSPLLGPAGAAAVFGPQKGARPADVPVLEAGLARFADVLREAGVAVDPATPGAGAAGGTGHGLLAWGAVIAPGSAAVGEALGLPAMVAGADAVVTGEGRYDDQSAAGKVPEYVAGLARAAGIPALLAAGSIAADPRGFAAAASLSELAGGSAAAIADPLRWAAAAGADLARRAVGNGGD